MAIHLEAARVHLRRYSTAEGEQAHLKFIRTTYPNFDTINLVIDGGEILVMFVDKGDYLNFPLYDSRNDSKGDQTSE